MYCATKAFFCEFPPYSFQCQRQAELAQCSTKRCIFWTLRAIPVKACSQPLGISTLVRQRSIGRKQEELLPNKSLKKSGFSLPLGNFVQCLVLLKIEITWAPVDMTTWILVDTKQTSCTHNFYLPILKQVSSLLFYPCLKGRFCQRRKTVCIPWLFSGKISCYLSSNKKCILRCLMVLPMQTTAHNLVDLIVWRERRTNKSNAAT